jgi:ribonuclease BN (tRNA processing enzyme)
VQLRFLGSGDAFGSGGRFNTCFHVTGPRSSFLIDCGATAMVAMRRFAVDPNTIRTVFLSHLHGDHFGGLPFLLLDARFVSKRQVPLTIVGPPSTAERLDAAMEVFFPGSASAPRPFGLQVVELAPGETRAIDEVTVRAFEVVHPSGAPSLSLRLEAEGKTIAYSGDTEWTEVLIEAGRSADLFVCEAYAYDAPVKNHMDYRTLERKLGALGAKQIVLTHPSAAMLGRTDLRYPLAQDGMVVEF